MNDKKCCTASSTLAWLTWRLCTSRILATEIPAVVKENNFYPFKIFQYLRVLDDALDHYYICIFILHFFI